MNHGATPHIWIFVFLEESARGIICKGSHLSANWNTSYKIWKTKKTRPHDDGWARLPCRDCNFLCRSLADRYRSRSSAVLITLPDRTKEVVGINIKVFNEVLITDHRLFVGTIRSHLPAILVVVCPHKGTLDRQSIVVLQSCAHSLKP